MKKLVLGAIGIVGLAIIVGCGSMTTTSQVQDELRELEESQPTKKDVTQAFLVDGLRTDTTRADIELSEILDGGPGKDGIPALTDPDFLSISQVSYLDTDDEGTVFVDGDVIKYYPNRILNRHEIVNDRVGETDVVVTFCPLCGTSLVFDPYIQGEKLQFGVSGKLWQSNLLMYDTKTESLRSQAFTQAKVGEYVGTELEILSFDVMTWDEFKQNYPTGLVLSNDTGYGRDYAGQTPYQGYGDSDDLYFPVDNDIDKRFHPKTMMIITSIDGEQAAIVKSELKKLTLPTDIRIGETIINAHYDNGEIALTDVSGVDQKHFEEMWFSYINRNDGSELVWSGSEEG